MEDPFLVFFVAEHVIGGLTVLAWVLHREIHNRRSQRAATTRLAALARRL